jgi:hypothetical protein
LRSATSTIESHRIEHIPPMKRSELNKPSRRDLTLA